MKCVVKEQRAPGCLKLVTRPVPKPGAGDVLVKVLAAAICGTDVHIRHWNDWAARRVSAGVIIGHEFAGEVVETGRDVKSIKIGDIVSAETHIVCNTCGLCRNGYQHVCYNTKLIGVNRDGCFAEYIAVPEINALVCDSSLSPEVLSLMEPLGAAIHGVMEYPVAAETVAIVGCGPIGAMAVAVARKAGAGRIIAVEPNVERGKAALKLGADHLVNPLEQDTATAVKALTDGGHGVDLVIDYSGSAEAIKAALSYCRPEAKIVCVGLPSKAVEFNLSEFAYRGLTMRGIAGRLMYRTWEQARSLLASGLDVSSVVTHVLPLEKFEEGLDLMERGECGKAVVKPFC
jgi:threonine 3-dehydrogenase